MSINARKKGARFYRHMFNSLSGQDQRSSPCFHPISQSAYQPCHPSTAPAPWLSLLLSHLANTRFPWWRCLAPPVHGVQVSRGRPSPLLSSAKKHHQMCSFYILRSGLIQSRCSKFSFMSTLCSKLPIHLQKKPMETTWYWNSNCFDRISPKIIEFCLKCYRSVPTYCSP